ncbi:hypothetical protein B0H12DRAFT_1148714 [Mycena haematopus]|nr:hypothetical protein B0H12DRAFT_1148714 [Mycena haematopus]
MATTLAVNVSAVCILWLQPYVRGLGRWELYRTGSRWRQRRSSSTAEENRARGLMKAVLWGVMSSTFGAHPNLKITIQQQHH